MTNNPTPDSSGQRRIDAYLDEVETALNQAGIPRERRRGIVDDLETQLRDMNSDAPWPPDEAVAIALLARLDPPQRYAQSRASIDLEPNRMATIDPIEPQPLLTAFSRDARRSVWLLWPGLFLLGFFFIGMFQVSEVVIINGPTPPQPSKYVSMIESLLPIVGLLIGFIMMVSGTIYGWIGLLRIGQSHGQLRGAIWAGVSALLVPTVLAFIAGFLFWYWMAVAYYDGPFIPNRGRAMNFIGGSLTGLLLTGGLIYLAVRVYRGPRRDRGASVASKSHGPAGLCV